MQFGHSFRTILLADDDEDDRMLFEDALHQVRPDIKLLTAGAGAFLIKALREGPLPDIIFLDLNMPGKNGFECLRDIRKDDSYRHIPVIIFSTTAQTEAVDRTYELGANYFMRKPQSFPGLKKLITQALSLDLRTPSITKRESFLLYSA